MNTEQLTQPIDSLKQRAFHALTSPMPTMSRLLLSYGESYYRSKVFVAQAGPNRLIAASGILLSLISRLRESATLADTHELYQQLVHEIKAFETTAHKQGYRSEFILVARYVLCATFDEIILKTHWGKESDWRMHTLLSTFQNDNQAEERFFLILDRLTEDTSLYIDLLELMYICLSLGFEGKYRQLEHGYEALETIKQNLYTMIQYHRDELENELSEIVKTTSSPSTTTQRLPLWLLTAFIFALLLGIYGSFHYFFEAHVTALFQEFTALQHFAQQFV